MIHWRRDRLPTPVFLGFPCGSAGKELACNAGGLGSIPGLGRSPGEGKDYPLWYSGLENSMDFTVHGVTKSQIWLSDLHFHRTAYSEKASWRRQGSGLDLLWSLSPFKVCFCLFWFLPLRRPARASGWKSLKEASLKRNIMIMNKEKDRMQTLLLLLLLLSRFSRVWLCATPETASYQAPLSLGFSRQEHWSGLPFPSPMHESESENEVAQSYPTLSDLMDCSLPGSSVHGIFQARVLEWGAIAFSEMQTLATLYCTTKELG